MKKRVPSILVALMLMVTLMLTACGGGSKTEDLSDSKYVGTWQFKEVSVADESGEIPNEWLIVVNGDGTGTSTSDGEEVSFTWKPVTDGFKTSGDLKVTFHDEGDNIAMKMMGISLTFEKQ